MSDPDFETISYKVEDRICTITLNRPERRNAYDSAMRKELLSAFDLTDADDAVRCVVITGAGGNFCVGADIAGGAKVFDPVARGDAPADREEVAGLVRDGAGLVALRIFRSLKPVIGAIDGVAAGAGASISCAFDVRIASHDARYAFVFARRGLIPEGASTWFLPRLVGVSTALEWFYSGRVIPAQEAWEMGLVRSLHPASELLPAARALADDFVRNSAAVSTALIRQMTWRALGMSHPMEAHRADTRAMRSRAASADLHEGVAAFAERRQPDFPDSLSGGLPECFPEWIEPQFR